MSKTNRDEQTDVDGAIDAIDVAAEELRLWMLMELGIAGRSEGSGRDAAVTWCVWVGRNPFGWAQARVGYSIGHTIQA